MFVFIVRVSFLGWTVAGLLKIQAPAQIKYHKIKTKTLGKLGLDQLNVLNYSYQMLLFEGQEREEIPLWDSRKQKLSNSNSSMVLRPLEVEWELFI